MTPERTRELLENCAKACGAALEVCNGLDDDGYDNGVLTYVWIRLNGELIDWNPITNSADEAEMEAKLRLDVEWFDDIGTVSVAVMKAYSDHPTPQAARRMAGCRAAEQIAKGM